MNRKGFTLIELILIMAILAIIALAVIPVINGGDAHGFEIGKPMLATDENIAAVIIALKRDASQTVTVMAYADKWTRDTVDDSMDEIRAVQKKLYDAGIIHLRVGIHLANKGGLEGDGTPVPAANGTYISLD